MIPEAWPDLDTGWLASALSAAFPDDTLRASELLLHDDGTNRRARFGLTWERGTGPQTVFVKASDPKHAALNAATGGVINEARLFGQEIDLRVDHPKVYRSIVDEESQSFLMLMEDVKGRGADPRDATRPLSVDQAGRGVEGLAALHGAFWGHRLDDDISLAWVEPYQVWMSMEKGIEIGLDRTADLLPAEVAAMSAVEIESEHWKQFIATLATGSQTLLHGDAHVGNTYVLPDDSVGFLDWQVLRRGNPSVDLGYFVQGALTVADRRTSEADLIERYRLALDLPDEERPSREDTWLRYCASAVHGLTLWLATAASRWQRHEVSFALVERYAAAFADLDTPAAIAGVSGGRR